MTAPFILLDTDVLSYFFRRDTRAEAYRSLIEGSVVAISFMTVAEIYQWAYLKGWGEPRVAAMELALRRYVTVPFSQGLCRRWAAVRAERFHKGRPISPQDAWIAATALENECPLLSNNHADFEGIDGLKMLSA